MVDKLGETIHIGQRVAFSFHNDPDVYIGEVIRFTRLKVELEYKPAYLSKYFIKTIKYPKRLIIIN